MSEITYAMHSEYAAYVEQHLVDYKHQIAQLTIRINAAEKAIERFTGIVRQLNDALLEKVG